MGNVLSSSNMEKIKKYSNVDLESNFRKGRGGIFRALLKNKYLRYIILKIHSITFNMLHGL